MERAISTRVHITPLCRFQWRHGSSIPRGTKAAIAMEWVVSYDRGNERPRLGSSNGVEAADARQPSALRSEGSNLQVSKLLDDAPVRLRRQAVADRMGA